MTRAAQPLTQSATLKVGMIALAVLCAVSIPVLVAWQQHYATGEQGEPGTTGTWIWGNDQPAMDSDGTMDLERFNAWLIAHGEDPLPGP